MEVHFKNRDITFRVTEEGHAASDKIERLSKGGNVGLLGYELIAAANVVYCELLCGGEVIDTVTYGQMIEQATSEQ